MVEQTKPGAVGQRYSESIEELRAFFRSRKVPFGAPKDLPPFAVLISEASPFSEEMGSMVRTILYQEDEQLGRAGLLDLVTIAVGGPDAGDAPGTQEAVRQIFSFLNAEVRQAHMSFASEDTDDLALDEPIAAEAPPESVPPVAGAWRTRPELMGAVPGRAEVPSRPPAGNEVLYRAMSLAAEDALHPPPPEAETAARTQPGVPPLWKSTPQPGEPFHEQSREPFHEQPGAPVAAASTRVPWWAIPAVGLALAAIGGAVYVARPMMEHRYSQRAVSRIDDAAPAPAGTASCVPPIAAGVTRSALEERSLWAHNLLEQKLYEAALPELQEIARLDPGYPGIKLDESDALLHAQRSAEARDAVDAQIGISECFAKLSAPAQDAYCKAQYAPAAIAGCRLQQAHIQQAAELQAALVHLELGHQVQPDGDASAALAELTRDDAASAKRARAGSRPLPAADHGAAPVAPAAADDAGRPGARTDAQAATRTRRSKSKGDASLVRGEGTDSAYGAYKKPE